MGTVAWMAFLCSTSVVAQSTVTLTSGQILEPAVYQGPEFGAQTGGPSSQAAIAQNDSSGNALRMALQAPSPVPPQTIQMAPAAPSTSKPLGTGTERSQLIVPAQPPTNQPLLDGKATAEEPLPGGNEERNPDNYGLPHEHVKPYGGGHPNDWSWGCGGSPYRDGPGLCDNYKVGPRWHVTVDGMVMSRDTTDLIALAAAMPDSFPDDAPSGIPEGIDPGFEQFSYGPGGRITFASQVSRCVGYDLQAVYEGINDWNASIVYPKEALDVPALVIPPDPDTEPGAPFPEGFQQRSLHYRSNYNSGELNFLTNITPAWRPVFGVRFIRFDDQIKDVLDQDVQVPLPGPRTDSIIPGPDPPANPILVNDPIGPTHETDRLNLFDVENNLMGFQIGLFHDTVRLNNRFAFEGFFNSGVYYNKVKYSNVMGVYTTQAFADNTRSTSATDSRVDTSNIVNNDTRDYAEISYVSEASLTGVCRLNKCWALRGGYQVLWMNNLHTADNAYLGNPEETNSMLFHGWHAGVECRR